MTWSPSRTSTSLTMPPVQVLHRLALGVDRDQPLAGHALVQRARRRPTAGSRRSRARRAHSADARRRGRSRPGRPCRIPARSAAFRRARRAAAWRRGVSSVQVWPWRRSIGNCSEWAAGGQAGWADARLGFGGSLPPAAAAGRRLASTASRGPSATIRPSRRISTRSASATARRAVGDQEDGLALGLQLRSPCGSAPPRRRRPGWHWARPARSAPGRRRRARARPMRWRWPPDSRLPASPIGVS